MVVFLGPSSRFGFGDLPRPAQEHLDSQRHVHAGLAYLLVDGGQAAEKLRRRAGWLNGHLLEPFHHILAGKVVRTHLQGGGARGKLASAGRIQAEADRLWRGRRGRLCGVGRIGFHGCVRLVANEAGEEVAGVITEFGFKWGRLPVAATQAARCRLVRPVVRRPVLANRELVLVVVHQVVQVRDGITSPRSSLAAIFVVTSQSDVRKEKEQTFSNATVAMPANRSDVSAIRGMACVARFAAPVAD